MRRILLAACLIAVSLPIYVAPQAKANHEPLAGCKDPGEKIQGYITASDGTELHYQVLLPKKELFGPGPYHSVLDYSGYQPGITFYDGVHRHFLCEGYAVAGVNIRGTGCSSGDFDYFEPRQAEDGREAIEFLTKQPWSTGRLAMVGKSYPGITQLFVAGQPLTPGEDPQTPKGLVAIVPGHVFGDLYRDVPFPGGIENVTFAAGWSAGRIYEPFTAPGEHYQASGDQECMANAAEHVQNPPQNPFVKSLYNQYDGELFYERSPWYWAKNIDVPTMLVQTWQDEQVGSRAIELVERFDPDLPLRVLATNGDHGEYYGSHVLPYIDEFLRFYLAREVPARFQGGTVGEFIPKNPRNPKKGTTTTRPETYAEALARYRAEDPVQINWETGAAGGRVPGWIERYGSWPPENQETWRLNMTPDGGLVGDQAPAGEVAYNYTPGTGTQQRGGFELTDDLPDETMAQWSETPAEGTYAQFETAPLASDKLLAGPASIDLTVSSTAPDTDFQVTMTEVRPDGGEVFVQQGWLRASHRTEDAQLSNELRPYQTHTIEDVQPLVPGQPAELRIEMFPFAHAFREGSKIRIYVEAPHTKPDLWGFALLPVPAVNTIHTGVGLSSVALPLLEGDAAKSGAPACGSLRNQPCRPAL
jgi:predicted acyl esterase